MGKLNLRVVLPDVRHQGYCPNIINGFAVLREALIFCLLHGKKLHVRAMYSNISQHLETLTKNRLFRMLPIVTEVTDSKVPGTVSYTSPYGARPEDYRSGVDYDSTCPHVDRVFETVRKACGDGYAILVLTDTYGWGELIAAHATTNVVVYDPERVCPDEFFRANRKIVMVACTSLRPDVIEDTLGKLAELYPDHEILDKTLHCPTIRDRGREALELAAKCDRIAIIGDRHSMQASYYACLIARYYRENGDLADRRHRVYLFEKRRHLSGGWFLPGEKIGILPTTSTSKSKVQEFAKRLESLKWEPIRSLDYNPSTSASYMCPGLGCGPECNRCC